jgi:hypothetical protein
MFNSAGMTSQHMLLLVVLVVILGFILYLVFGLRSAKALGSAVGGMLDSMDDNVVSWDERNSEVYEGDNDDEEYFGGAAAKKSAAKKVSKAVKGDEIVMKEEVITGDVPVEKSHDHPAGDKPAFRGHFLSERVVEKHDPATGKVTTYRVSVRGSMKDTHRVVIKIKDVTEGNVQEKDARSRKLKLRGDGKGDYVVAEKKEKNRGTFNAEEKETAIRILHGAINSSMLDESTREKIITLVTKKL